MPEARSRRLGRTCGPMQRFASLRGLASPEGAVVAIDAPLIVKNLTGQRPVEFQLTSIFARYDAGPHSSNRSNPNFQESGKTQRMARLLLDLGYRQQIAPLKQQAQQTLLEVFPAPALVILFPCHLHSTHTHCRPPRYKHKRDRSWPELCSEWEIYRARLRSLECREPALRILAGGQQADRDRYHPIQRWTVQRI